MEFGIDRTSDRENKPCEGAYKKKFDYVDRRICKTIEEFDSNPRLTGNGKFRSKGINHKQTKNGIERTFPNDCEGWFIEINTLEELLEFEKEHGDLVISRNWQNHYIMQITIYDGYIE